MLIHGASSDAWYWHRVIPELRVRGHDVIAPDLPSDDDAAGFAEYADAVMDAIAGRDPDRGLIVVAQSMGGFTAAMVCERAPVDLLVLVAAMVPAPGERPGDWWANTGYVDARRALDEREGRAGAGNDPWTVFFHDAPSDVVEAARERGERGQSGTPFQGPPVIDAWPDVPTRFLLCRDDRFFPADFMRRVVRDRLGIAPDELDGGHLPALARPADLVARLESYRAELAPMR